MSTYGYDGDKPSNAALAAIEAEWPVIEAELAVVEAECRLAVSPDAVAVRRHRRAVAELAAVIGRFGAGARVVARKNVAALASRRSRSPFPGAALAPFAA